MATALITGASSGIGLALARVFAADGIDVILSARSEDKLHALAKEVREKYRVKARVIAADLSLPGEAQKIYDRVVEQVDYLVNNAGFGVYGGFAETDWMAEAAMLQGEYRRPHAVDQIVFAGYDRQRPGKNFECGFDCGLSTRPDDGRVFLRPMCCRFQRR